MTIELVDGHAGKPHISGDDLGDFKAGMLGDDGYVFKRANMLAATLNSSNSLTIATGSGVMPGSGRHFRVTSSETLTITSGTQGQNRNDLCVVRASTSDDSTTVENAQLLILRGTPTSGTAADPETQDGDLVLYRIQLTGVSVAEPIALFDVMVPYNDFRKTAWMLYEAKGGLTGAMKYLQPAGWEPCTLDAVFGPSNYADFIELGTALGTIKFKKSGYYRISPRFTYVGAGGVSCRILSGSTEVCFGASTNDSTARNNTTQCSYITYINAGDTRTIQCLCDNKINRFLSAAFSNVDVEYLGA